MANKILINGISKTDKKGVTKKVLPQIQQQEVHFATGTKKGATIKIKDGKAIRLIIDDTIVYYKDIPKLFPLNYLGFYAQETLSTSSLGELFKENIIYIPRQMAIEHKVEIIYRVKMQQFICTIQST